MSEIGAYDGIDMAGINPAWYEGHVPAEVQREFVAYDRNLRVIWTPKYEGFRVIEKIPGQHERWADGYLDGWACRWLRKPPLDKILEGTLAEVRFMDKYRKFVSKKEADKATDEGWKKNKEIARQKADEENFGGFLETALERIKRPVSALEREDEARRDEQSGRRHLQRSKLILPAGVRGAD